MPRLTRRQPVAMRGVERGVVADAAGQLDLDVEATDDVGQQLAVAALAEGGVEVDQVDPLGPVGLPLQRGVERGSVGRLAAELALDQAHGLSLGDVDGGEEFESHPAIVSIGLRRVGGP